MSCSSPNPGWSEGRVESLTALWRSGLSAAQIARVLGGVTRNAVIGKLHRLGLAGRAAPRPPRPIRADRPPTQPSRPRARPPAPRRIGATTPREVEHPDLDRTCDLAALTDHVCRWPIGDPKVAGFGFCGRPVGGALPYCETHRRRAYRAGAEPLDRDPVLRRLLAGQVR